VRRADNPGDHDVNLPAPRRTSAPKSRRNFKKELATPPTRSTWTPLTHSLTLSLSLSLILFRQKGSLRLGRSPEKQAQTPQEQKGTRKGEDLSHPQVGWVWLRNINGLIVDLALYDRSSRSTSRRGYTYTHQPLPDPHPPPATFVFP